MTESILFAIWFLFTSVTVGCLVYEALEDETYAWLSATFWHILLPVAGVFIAIDFVSKKLKRRKRKC